jgi:hypothetical protein
VKSIEGDAFIAAVNDAARLLHEERAHELPDDKRQRLDELDRLLYYCPVGLQLVRELLRAAEQGTLRLSRRR